MKIEAITLNAADTKQAEQLGIDRVELVGAIGEGGLTPSHGVIKTVLESVSIPVQIMVRPHSFSFCYDDKDWEIMKEDIAFIRSLGGKRIVIGGINSDGSVDEALLDKVIKRAPDIDITFHRAFDEVASQTEAYRTLAKYSQNVKRILTSGGKAKAPQAILELQELVTLSREINGPEILVGSGVNPDNIGTLHKQIDANQYHIGSGLRRDGDFQNELDAEKLQIVEGQAPRPGSKT